MSDLGWSFPKRMENTCHLESALVVDKCGQKKREKNETRGGLSWGIFRFQKIFQDCWFRQGRSMKKQNTMNKMSFDLWWCCPKVGVFATFFIRWDVFDAIDLGGGRNTQLWSFMQVCRKRMNRSFERYLTVSNKWRLVSTRSLWSNIELEGMHGIFRSISAALAECTWGIQSISEGFQVGETLELLDWTPYDWNLNFCGVNLLSSWRERNSVSYESYSTFTPWGV